MGAVIAIGALGGSGTRAIAQVLMDAGIYLGDSLNNANDNKLFTRLFKNPFVLQRRRQRRRFRNGWLSSRNTCARIIFPRRA